MAPISDLARTTRQAKPVEEPDEDETPSKANESPTSTTAPPPPPEPPKPEPVKPMPIVPPPPPPPPPKADEPAIEPIKPVQQVQQQLQQQLQALPPLQKPMQIIKPQPVAKPTEQKVDKKEDQQFDALLKNLSKDQPKADQITHDKPVQTHQRTGSEGMQSNAMTASEKSLIQERLKACWVFPAGAYNAEDLIVNVQAEFNEDKTLKSASVLDSRRYGSDPAFRAAGDAALRALRNPMCNPLPLPDGKYADWGTIDMTFDPKIMMAP